jgi:pimeloyl-ACP methyl ester carboxylesterase
VPAPYSLPNIGQAQRAPRAVLALLLALTAPVLAQSAAPPTLVPARLPVTFQTEDGWTLSGEYHPPKNGGEVVILVHGLGGTRRQWDAFARHLAALGLGTLAFDLRGYGQSLQGPYGTESFRNFNDLDWQKLPKDVDAALAFLGAQGVPEERTALVGSIVGANIAAMAAVRHPKTAWLALLSPGNDYHGLSVGLAGDLDTLVAAAQDDPDSTAVCQGLVQLDESRTFLTAPMGRGIGMLADKPFRAEVLTWIKDAAAASSRP